VRGRIVWVVPAERRVHGSPAAAERLDSSTPQGQARSQSGTPGAGPQPDADDSACLLRRIKDRLRQARRGHC
jgi:hypothetical protein